jgi:hypothetical protein
MGLLRLRPSQGLVRRFCIVQPKDVCGWGLLGLATHGIQHVDYTPMSVAMWMGFTTVGVGLLAGWAVAALGAPGLLLASLTLAGAIVFDRLRVVHAATAAATVPLVAWATVFVGCELTLGRTCAWTDAEVGMLAWAGLLVAVGLAWSLLQWRRQHRAP